MKRIVIIGAGFAGLAAAKALRHANANVLVIDRANHNLFQPLLYQVATTVLSPAEIASPIRGLLKNQRNTTVILGEVSGIALANGRTSDFLHKLQLLAANTHRDFDCA